MYDDGFDGKINGFLYGPEAIFCYAGVQKVKSKTDSNNYERIQAIS